MLTDEKQERRKTSGGTVKSATEQSVIDVLLDKNTNIELECVPDSDSVFIQPTSPQLFDEENNLNETIAFNQYNGITLD